MFFNVLKLSPFSHNAYLNVCLSGCLCKGLIIFSFPLFANWKLPGCPTCSTFLKIVKTVKCGQCFAARKHKIGSKQLCSTCSLVFFSFGLDIGKNRKKKPYILVYLSPNALYVCVSVDVKVCARLCDSVCVCSCVCALLSRASFSQLLHASLGSVLIGPVSLCFQTSVLVVWCSSKKPAGLC